LGTNKEGTYFHRLTQKCPTQDITVGCGGLQEQIPHQGLDPQCTLSCPSTPHASIDSSRSDYCQYKGAFSLNNDGAKYGVVKQKPLGDEEAKHV
jgi:hypothetical protein